MKQLKEYILTKNNFFKNLGIGNGKVTLIKKWCNGHKIKNYTINDDLTIDVVGGVDLRGYEEKQLPDYIQFRNVTKYFYIGDSSKLESLKGCPKKVGDSFYCYGCPKLETLKGCPEEVGIDFSCSGCSKITSLEGCPKKVGGCFYCYECSKLETLKGCPEEVGDDFWCNSCSKITSLEGCPQIVRGCFYCYNCGKQFTEYDVKKYCKIKGEINV